MVTMQIPHLQWVVFPFHANWISHSYYKWLSGWGKSNTWYPFCTFPYPRKVHFVVLESFFHPWEWGITCKRYTQVHSRDSLHGLCPYDVKRFTPWLAIVPLWCMCCVIPSTGEVGLSLCKQAAVETVSVRKLSGNLASKRIALVVSTSCQLSLSAVPFCLGGLEIISSFVAGFHRS